MALTFAQLREYAKEYASRPMSFSREDFISKVEEYVNSLPPERQEWVLNVITQFGVISVKYKELPRKLREDPEFFERYIRVLTGR
jgi:hypothetical protein